MSKQIIGKESAVEALASLCRDYRGTALRAIRQGGEEVFIPADPSKPQEMLDALADPEGMIRFESQSDPTAKEPCYISLAEFLAGRNANGTEHRGYLSVDVVAKLVTDLKDRDGRSVVSRMQDFDQKTFLLGLIKKPESYCL